MGALTDRLAGIAIAAATAIVIVAVAILPFLNGAWVRLEQDRAGAGALTGYDVAQLDTIAGALLADLAPWGGDFDVVIDGKPVLDARERGHMRDVRGVFLGFFGLAIVGAAGLVVALRGPRTPERRAAAWGTVRGGARALAIALVVAGAFALLAFDALFELFHRLFFSGNYAFDPRTERLVQLFPVQFWSESAIAVGAVAFVLAIGTFAAASRRHERGGVVAHLAASRLRP